MNTRKIYMLVIALSLAIGLTGGNFAQASAATCTKYHTVVAGEYLVQIARLYGTTWRVLAQINNLSNPNLIYPGQKLCVAMDGPIITPPPSNRPSVSVTSVVVDQSVTIKTADFPANDSFEVMMGPTVNEAKDGIKVGTINSGRGGSFSATFRIPAQLKGMSRIGVRLQSPTSGYFAYNSFENKTSNPPVSSRCDWAQFVRDVTVPDGSTYAPGAGFTKTWRLKNIGTCTWTSSYALVFDRGDAMGGQATVALSGNVRPGESVDVSVNLIAPTNPGDYQGFWKLRNASRTLFGIGSEARTAFWVKIRVNQPAQTVFDLTADYCKAEWRSGSGVLACPAPSENTDTGFINRLDNPKLEVGQDNEYALVTYPSKGEGGFISGHYPAFQVKSGDHFKAVIGCMDASPNCNVMFQLNYRIDGGAVQNMRTWTEVYDKSITKVDVDLSSLAGKNVEFILRVLNNGSSENDYAFWLLPRIVR